MNYNDNAKIGIYSKNKRLWYTNREGSWVGKHFVVSNLSNGYHGILAQWWNFYKSNKAHCNVLLVSESTKVKEQFSLLYPLWSFTTINMKSDNETADIVADLCDANDIRSIEGRFDLIINQATLEHVYDPFGAMKNIIGLLKEDGILVTHTHPPNFAYHAYPHDCFRFMNDWWFILPEKIKDIVLEEFVVHGNEHVFTCYRKTKALDL